MYLEVGWLLEVVVKTQEVFQCRHLSHHLRDQGLGLLFGGGVEGVAECPSAVQRVIVVPLHS